MKRLLALALVALFAIGGFAPANADTIPPVTATDQIPFDVPVSISGQYQNIPATGTDTGFVGVCDFQLQCVGLSTRIYESGGNVTVTPSGARVSGVICIRSYRAPCGSSTSPGTGVVITGRSYTLPSVYITRPTIDTQTCVWVFDPRFSPARCTKAITDAIIVDDLPGTLTVEVPENVADGLITVEENIPDRIVINEGR